MDQTHARELIDQAERHIQFCACGQMIVPVGRARAVWLECPALDQPRSALSRLLTLDFVPTHTRRRLIDFVEAEPAVARAA